MSAPFVNNLIALDCDIELRKPNEYDIARSLDWLRDPDLRYSFHFLTPPTIASYLGDWSKILTDKTQRAFALYNDYKHIGMAGIKEITDRSAELWLYIASENYRGRGLGQKTMKWLEIYAMANLSSKMAVLHVRRDNTVALSLYKKMNYAELPWNDEYCHTGFDPNNVMFLGKKLI